MFKNFIIYIEIYRKVVYNIIMYYTLVYVSGNLGGKLLCTLQAMLQIQFELL